jgi:hypothetical protein
MYRVVWVREVLDEVASIWLQADASLRQAVTLACHQIDQRLQSRPEKEGESRFGSERFLFVTPLTITFHVDEVAKQVIVAKVRLYQKRKK